MCNVVLSTDMGSHFDLLDVFVKAVTDNPDIWAWQDRNLITIMAMHLSDIVNPARPVEIAMKWGHLIVQECLEQARPVLVSVSKCFMLTLILRCYPDKFTMFGAMAYAASPPCTLLICQAGAYEQ